MMTFQQVQRQFIAYLRDPEHEVLPEGLSEQGAGIYGDLLYNKFNDCLALCFPVTQSLLGEAAWQQLIKDFIAQHLCISPYYRQIPDEFIHYLQIEWTNTTQLPYLIELAHFEWTEMYLAISEAEISADFDTITVNKDCLNYRPLFAPVLQLLHYVYPVHRINLDYQTTEPPEQATHILAFRDTKEAVQFIELNSATARLVELLQHANYTMAEAIQQLARELQHPEPTLLFNFAVTVLNDLITQGAILGIRKTPEASTKQKQQFYSNCDYCPLHYLIKQRLSHLSLLLSIWFETNTAVFAPLSLRLLIAYEFLESGLEKLSGNNWFADLRFPFPFNMLSADMNWTLAMGLEIIAPIALILGFATRFFSFSLLILTLVAIIAVHLPTEWHSLAELWRGYAITDQGYGNYKLPLMYVLMLISLLFSGSGQLSVDAYLTKPAVKISDQ